jgi:hypothetical protein
MTDETKADQNDHQEVPIAGAASRPARANQEMASEARPEDDPSASATTETASPATTHEARGKPDLPEEFGGYDGPEPTRYGDWQHRGRVSDF